MPALIQKFLFEHPDGMARAACDVYLQSDGQYHADVMLPKLETAADSDHVLMTEPVAFSGTSVEDVLAQVRSKLATAWAVDAEFVQPVSI